MMTEEEVREWAEEPDKDILDIVEESKGVLEQYDVIVTNVERGHSNVFFTEKACHHHMKQNHYHFNNPYSYVKHAWRNPEVKNLFKAIREIVEKNK